MLIRSIPLKEKRKKKIKATLQHTPDFSDVPPRGDRCEQKLLGVTFSAKQ